MKTKAKKPLRRVSKKVLAKQKVRQARPTHKRILLHPASVLTLLCIGVLIAGWTIRGAADSYSVTASLPAPIPASPATIISPVDQTHYTTASAIVAGSCPSNTYVKLYSNGTFSGAASCGNGVTSYQIGINLSLGANTLYTRIFNVTDIEGPPSAQITIFYDMPSPTPVVPISPPLTIQVSSQDNKTYSSNSVTTVSPYPTIKGTAPPNSKVTVTIHSNVITCITYADSNGAWSCALDQPLDNAMHTVNISATTPSGQILNFPAYHIIVSSNVRPIHAINASGQPFLIRSDYQYHVYAYGQSSSLSLGLSGGTAPYAINIAWGDGAQSTIARKDQSVFIATHVYRPLGNQLKDYTVKIQAVDNNGSTTAFLQTITVVRGSQLSTVSGQCTASSATTSLYSAQASNTFCGNTVSSLSSKVKQWLWLVGPTYAVVVLMLFSFWLGERQEVLVLINKEQPKRRHHR